MIWSGNPHLWRYEQRARQARARVFAHLLATARRALARAGVRTAPPSFRPRRSQRVKPDGDAIAHGCPGESR